MDPPLSPSRAPENIHPFLLPQITRRRFTSVPKESIVDREQRLLQELRRFDDLDRTITAIPYEYVGNDIRSLYPKTMAASLKRNYPDWHMLTPAYRLRFAGMSWTEHVTSLVSRRSGNNLIQRMIR
ncbi:hypothetical protein PHYPSEUDO_015565 [Phytophthora pseudosyringae]|uniref:Uncharacterized protein n=1 Tax=Phytophthora pseudosyringae TaxID=221518 RepID=A0A8T1V6G4_9STRA|nr:hypothetical protein PHYPSEUDO_015565 [Phytophthora pseudosyringae]